MSLQLTSLDPYAQRSAAPLQVEPPPAPAAPVPSVAPVAASGSASGAALGHHASGRHPSEAPAGTVRATHAARAAGAGREAAAAGGEPNAVPSTVSLGNAPETADSAAKSAKPTEPAGGWIPEKPQPPISEQMLEFLHSIWEAAARAITLPKDKDGAQAEAVAGVEAAAAVSSSGQHAAVPGAAAVSAAGHSSEARPVAVAQARAGNPPVLGNALSDSLPTGSAPNAAPLVYADPTLRRSSGA